MDQTFIQLQHGRSNVGERDDEMNGLARSRSRRMRADLRTRFPAGAVCVPAPALGLGRAFRPAGEHVTRNRVRYRSTRGELLKSTVNALAAFDGYPQTVIRNEDLAGPDG